MIVTAWLAIATALQAAPATSREPGEAEEWQQVVPLMRGDKFATVVLSIDKQGRATRCGLKNTNIHDSDLAFFICQSFKNDWRTQPVLQDGVPVATTVERHLTMRGHEGSVAMDAAWKRYKAAHPDAKRPD